MSKRKEYRVGEIFRHNGETYKCVRDLNEFGCEICEMPPKICDEDFLLCSDCNRTDKTNIHFVRVTEPEEGMLFRASDGVLYELKKLEYRGRGCYLYGYMSCSEIDEEAFGEMIQEQELHWHPVEEKKEETMENQKRHLELAVVKVEGDQVTFRIAEQTHREDEFCENGEKFKSSCGVILNSQSSPDINRGCTILFVRGIASCMDDKEITVSLFNFARIMEAVTEYNETDGKGYKKPWPQKGGKYFCIQSTGYVTSTDYDNHPIDNDRREFGNFFRTREEAEAALERVKKALKGE